MLVVEVRLVAARDDVRPNHLLLKDGESLLYLLRCRGSIEDVEGDRQVLRKVVGLAVSVGAEGEPVLEVVVYVGTLFPARLTPCGGVKENKQKGYKVLHFLGFLSLGLLVWSHVFSSSTFSSRVIGRAYVQGQGLCPRYRC